MSDMGLYASIYEQLRVYADRFDCALVKLNSQNKTTADKARKDLAETLREICSAHADKPGPHLVAIVVRQELSGKLANFEDICKSLADALDSNVPKDEDIEQLENIASAIDKECLNAGARMRGRA
jgi:hypothetical protein